MLSKEVWLASLSAETVLKCTVISTMAVLGYIVTKFKPPKGQTWGVWLENLILERHFGPYVLRSGDQEMLNVFPGWAVRRRGEDGGEGKLSLFFSIDIGCI